MRELKKIKPFFTDERGQMSLVINKGVKITSVLFITCKKGAIRANHYHKKDTHYAYLISGKMEYTYKKMSSNSHKKNIIVNPGSMIYTPSMTAHAMRFLEDSTFLALSTEARQQNDYEEDLIRVKLI